MCMVVGVKRCAMIHMLVLCVCVCVCVCVVCVIQSDCEVQAGFLSY